MQLNTDTALMALCENSEVESLDIAVDGIIVSYSSNTYWKQDMPIRFTI